MLKRLLSILVILAKITTVQLAGCPEEFLNMSQSNWPLPKWNGQLVSGCGPLYYCPGRARCRFECTTLSNIAPDFNINGRLYSVTELSDAFGGTRVDSQHPHYTFEHDCTSGMTFRCVISQTHFSPSYTSEIDVERCDSGVTPSLTVGTSSASLPSSTPAVTPSTPWTVDHVGIGTGFTVSLAVIVIGIVPIIIVLCCWKRKKRRGGTGTSSPQSTQMPLTPALSLPTSVAQTPETDDHSSVTETVPGPSAVPSEVDDISFRIMITEDSSSMRRDVGDGGEELIPPLSVPAANEDGTMKLVAGRYTFC